MLGLRHWRGWSGVALGLALSGCLPPPEQTPRTFRVADGFIRDPEGRAVILRGANVSGRHKEAPYFDFHRTGDFARMRSEWGMNSVRYLVSWAALEPERDGYNEAYLEELHRRVSEATDAGLLVFLDLHQDLYGEGFLGGNGMPRWTCDAAHYDAYVPREPWFMNYTNPEITACYDGFWTSRDLQQKYVVAWAMLAERFRDVPGVIGFDPMNEPYWGSIPPDVLESTRLARLYREIIAAVRVHRPDWLAFLEPSASRNLGFRTHLPVFTEPNIVYAPHSYDARAESGEGFDPSRREAILESVASLRTEADALGAALVLGEYGGMAGHPGILDYMDAEYAAAGQARAGAQYWNYARSENYGLLDLDGNPKQALLAGVARPYPERVAGRPGPWSMQGDTFEFVYTPDGSLSAPTRIALPAGEFSVACEGGRATRVDGAVEISPDGPGDVRVTVHALH